MRAPLLYWLPFLLLAAAVGVVLWTVVRAIVGHALGGALGA